jgi:pilus assembly protein CpaB
MNYETRKNLWLIAVAVAFALIAATIATAWMKSRIAAIETSGKSLTSVVAAARDVPMGKRVESDDVRVVKTSGEAAPSDAFHEIGEVVGQVARSPIYSGEVLMARRISGYAGGSALAAVLQPGMRAVTIRVDDVIGVGGFVLPENRVDVISAFETGGTPRAETIIRNVRVLAVDQRSDATADGPVVGRAVTLEVTPADAEKIAAARQRGSLQLTLRNPLAPSPTGVLDPEEIAEDTSRLIAAGFALSQLPQSTPVPKPKPQSRVTLIRGTTITTGVSE